MSIEDTLQERGNSYGEFIDNAECAQSIKHAMKRTRNWGNMGFDNQEALDIIASKISRILTGDAEHLDSWHDIQGYAKLVEDRISKSDG